MTIRATLQISILRCIEDQSEFLLSVMKRRLDEGHTGNTGFSDVAGYALMRLRAASTWC